MMEEVEQEIVRWIEQDENPANSEEMRTALDAGLLAVLGQQRVFYEALYVHINNPATTSEAYNLLNNLRTIYGIFGNPEG